MAKTEATARSQSMRGPTWAYIYAIIGGTQNHDFGSIGLNGSDVYTVADGDVSAVISNVPKTGKLRPERRHLAAHQAVLTRLTEYGATVLPVSFGTIAEGSEAVRKLLSRYQQDLTHEVNRVEGKVEMELRVSLEAPNIFEYFIHNHPELKEARDRVFDGKHEPSRDEKIDLGQTFERILDQEREKCTKMVERAIEPYCKEIKQNKCRNEKEVMRLSCLIEKGTKKDFESAVDEASKPFDDNFVFEYTGPFPPYNFIEIHLKV